MPFGWLRRSSSVFGFCHRGDTRDDTRKADYQVTLSGSRCRNKGIRFGAMHYIQPDKTASERVHRTLQPDVPDGLPLRDVRAYIFLDECGVGTSSMRRSTILLRLESFILIRDRRSRARLYFGSNTARLSCSTLSLWSSRTLIAIRSMRFGLTCASTSAAVWRAIPSVRMLTSGCSVSWARRSESRPFAARKVDHLRV